MSIQLFTGLIINTLLLYYLKTGKALEFGSITPNCFTMYGFDIFINKFSSTFPIALLRSRLEQKAIVQNVEVQ